MIFLAFVLTVLIWGSTPLAINWSGVGIHPLLGLGLRSVIAVTACLLLLKLMGAPVLWHRKALKNYLAGSMGLGGGMIFVYLGASAIPSGLVSVIFGLSPAVSGLLGQLILKEKRFSALQWCSLVVAVSGLVVLSVEQFMLDFTALIGVLMVFFATFLFSLSGVLVKRYQLNSHLLSQTFGTLIFSLPIFFLSAAPHIEGIQWAEVPTSTFGAIVYLGIVGSIIGLISYYHLLRELSPSSAALITMITPVIALCLGVWLNNENVEYLTVVGVVLVLFGLGIYIWENRARVDLSRGAQVEQQ